MLALNLEVVKSPQNPDIGTCTLKATHRKQVDSGNTIRCRHLNDHKSFLSGCMDTLTSRLVENKRRALSTNNIYSGMNTHNQAIQILCSCLPTVDLLSRLPTLTLQGCLDHVPALIRPSEAQNSKKRHER
jgi:hypothetical protein